MTLSTLSRHRNICDCFDLYPEETGFKKKTKGSKFLFTSYFVLLFIRTTIVIIFIW